MARNNSQIYSLFYLGNKSCEFLKFQKPKYAYAYYKNKRIDLLTGQEELFSISHWLKQLDKVSLKDEAQQGRVIHFFYELGAIILNLENQSLSNTTTLLALDIEYGESKPYRLAEITSHNTYEILKAPTKEEYRVAFEQGRKELEEGNCYQFNLTFPFYGKFEKKLSEAELVSLLWRSKEHRGAYAHGTSIPYLKKFFLSNSPECLFQAENLADGVKLYSMPIKGTVPLDEGDKGESFAKAWEKLSHSKKDQAELYMITDLVRNDLAKIEEPIAKIIFKKKPMRVPKILHQFSLIEVFLMKNYFLGKIMRALFPGGSITGAPKKRVVKILDNLEDSERGFYCGSTLLLFENIKAASINIRSLEYDTNDGHFKYSAGGGITLLSDWEDEFNEMQLKVRSFLDLLNN